MKNLTLKGASMLVLSAFLFGPVATHAQIGAGIVGDVKADLNGVLNADTNINADVNANMDTSTSSSSTASMKNDERAATNSFLKINSNGVAITSSAQVNSEADLEIFNSNFSVQDEKVAKVETESDTDDESKVEVVYKHNGKLFGFIPMMIKSTTVVEAKSNSEIKVETKMPWWAFLVAKAEYDQSELETRIKNNASVRANATVNASAQAKAEVVEAVVAEVQAYVNANAEAKVNR